MEPRVRLVEDDPSIREVTALCLATGGLEAVTAADGRDALSRFHEQLDDVGPAIAREHARPLGGTPEASRRPGGGLRVELRAPVTQPRATAR